MMNTIIGCEEKEEPKRAESIELISGDNQSEKHNSSLASPIQIIIRDQNKNPYSGALVLYSNSDGFLDNKQSVTDKNGKASVIWTLGEKSEQQQLTISSLKEDGKTHLEGSPIVVSATSLIPNSIELISGSNQVGKMGVKLPEEIKFIVKDQNKNPVLGALISFSVNDGVLNKQKVVTDELGIGSVEWILGTTNEIPELVATSLKPDGKTYLEGSPLVVSATSLIPYSIEIISGSNQTGKMGEKLSEEIKFIVKDQNKNPVVGALISFSVNDGVLNKQKVVTDELGIGSVQWTLGTTDEIPELVAISLKPDGKTYLKGSPIKLNANLLKPKTIKIISGNNQSSPIVSILPEPITVIVIDQFENPYSNIQVIFRDLSNSNFSITTDNDGMVEFDWKLGVKIGNQTLKVNALFPDRKTLLLETPIEINAMATELPSVSDIEGNEYETVLIGEQVWMAENLKSTKYSNGDPIELISGATEWSDLGNNNVDKAYCFYDLETYGALYTYAAAVNEVSGDEYEVIQGVCPDGWHVPNNSDWEKLEEYLANNGHNYDGTIGWVGDGTSRSKISKSLSSSLYWYYYSLTGTPGNNQSSNNSSGFNALPGGYRESYYPARYSIVGMYAGFWTSTESSDEYAIGRSYTYNIVEVSNYDESKSSGMSVRCIKD